MVGMESFFIGLIKRSWIFGKKIAQWPSNRVMKTAKSHLSALSAPFAIAASFRYSVFSIRKSSSMLPKFLAALVLLPAAFAQLRAVQPQIGTFASGRFHHTLTGTEFDLTSGWVIRYQGLSGGGGQEVRFTVSTGNPSAPPVDLLVWMKPDNIAPGDIADRLHSSLDFKRGQRSTAAGFHMLKATLQLKIVGGQAAESVEATYNQGDVKMIEYDTWAYSTKTHLLVLG